MTDKCSIECCDNEATTKVERFKASRQKEAFCTACYLAYRTGISDPKYAHETKKLKSDNRGRINLGTEYGDKIVRVAIVEVEDKP